MVLVLDPTSDAAFYCAVTETTRATWERYVQEVGVTPGPQGGGQTIDESAWKYEWRRGMSWEQPFPDVVLGPQHPVSGVSLDDVMAFCEHYDLDVPSRMEWTAAYRAGTSTRYWWGESPDVVCQYANCNDITAGERFGVPYPCADGSAVLAPVGSYPPNPLGIYDIAGNVWEWTATVRDGVVTEPAVRGGSGASSPDRCGHESEIDMTYYPSDRADFFGFRCIKRLSPQ